MAGSKKVSVRASGGVVVRGAEGSLEVALVHRPSYDDWTIPKGKDDPGEMPHQAALREVHEETGFHCRLVAPAGATSYQVRSGQKRVEYFLMRPLRYTGFESNDEVDSVRWMSPKKAAKKLTYEHDRRLLSSIDAGTAARHTTLHLVRHAAAGDRSSWKGPDNERPLTKKGSAQSGLLSRAISPTRPERVLSSPYVRCLQTVQPLAAKLKVDVEAHDALAEGASRKALGGLLDELAGTSAVLCSHGDVIPTLLNELHTMGVQFLSPLACKKGSTWTIDHDGTDYTTARYWLG